MYFSCRCSKFSLLSKMDMTSAVLYWYLHSVNCIVYSYCFFFAPTPNAHVALVLAVVFDFNVSFLLFWPFFLARPVPEIATPPSNLVLTKWSRLGNSRATLALVYHKKLVMFDISDNVYVACDSQCNSQCGWCLPIAKS